MRMSWCLNQNKMSRRICPRYIDTIIYFIIIFHVFECLIFFIFLSYLISFFHRRVYDNDNEQWVEPSQLYCKKKKNGLVFKEIQFNETLFLGKKAFHTKQLMKCIACTQ